MTKCPLGAVVQIIPDRLPKMEKAKPRQEMSGGVVAANVTPQPPPQITATQGCKRNAAAATADNCQQGCKRNAAAATADKLPPRSRCHLPASLTVEQMRTAGALAGARKKAKLAANKRL